MRVLFCPCLYWSVDYVHGLFSTHCCKGIGVGKDGAQTGIAKRMKGQARSLNLAWKVLGGNEMDGCGGYLKSPRQACSGRSRRRKYGRKQQGKVKLQVDNHMSMESSLRTLNMQQEQQQEQRWQLWKVLMEPQLPRAELRSFAGALID
ncbi:uncharacterized protein CLUP02_10298 [Colletotrichum lupini]|uniref:Uncharacterized protein n=1 Tax=Colletotrichum lupini TaxID=145971 RepID=A0A9Q8WJ82_9PEZI|nr:uncharacterized protein CLUP02_10298 [Colletotrichum lupini]UQC84802.1 hypothetical protein CLUP02_10298 [Colletotrichum lupini]